MQAAHVNTATTKIKATEEIICNIFQDSFDKMTQEAQADKQISVTDTISKIKIIPDKKSIANSRTTIHYSSANCTTSFSLVKLAHHIARALHLESTMDSSYKSLTPNQKKLAENVIGIHETRSLDQISEQEAIQQKTAELKKQKEQMESEINKLNEKLQSFRQQYYTLENAQKSLSEQTQNLAQKKAHLKKTAFYVGIGAIAALSISGWLYYQSKSLSNN